jgi:hypothetical protein
VLLIKLYTSSNIDYVILPSCNISSSISAPFSFSKYWLAFFFSLLDIADAVDGFNEVVLSLPATSRNYYNYSSLRRFSKNLKNEIICPRLFFGLPISKNIGQ